MNFHLFWGLTGIFISLIFVTVLKQNKMKNIFKTIACAAITAISKMGK